MLRKNRFLAVLVGSFLAVAAISALTATSNTVYARPLPQTTGNVERGKYLVRLAGCGGCHGDFKLASDKGVPLAGGNEFNLGPLGVFYSANLTILQKWTADDFKKVLHEGVDPQSGRVLAPAMPYQEYHGMSDDDVSAIGAYLQTLTPVTNDVPKAQPGPVAGFALKKLDPVSVPMPAIDKTAGYGRYMVENIVGCGGCHSPTTQLGAPLTGHDLQGGGRNLGTDQQPLYASPIVGSVLNAEGYTYDSFVNAMKVGIRPWGARIPSQMPYRNYVIMTDNDLTAIWNFLQTKGPIQAWPATQIPPATRAATAAGTVAATMSGTQSAATQSAATMAPTAK